MTEIRIKRLSLENFKCHDQLTLTFNGGNASIYGDNASGKTSIYDAVTWLLFGKDSSGNGEKNIEIKPLDANGEVKDHLAVTAVEAVLDVSGEEVTLRRTYKEVWATKRGSSEASYEGNTSEYYVDGVPCKKNAFQGKVNELVDEETFRKLTSVSYFASQISWQERRATLFDVAGVMDDKDILQTADQFSPLVESMGKLSLEDYKKKLLAEKKRFTGAKSEIPARISECQKTIDDLRSVDFAGARAELEILNAQKDNLSEQLLSIEHDSAQDAKRMEIREAQLELAALENENKAYRNSQKADTVDLSRVRYEIAILTQRMNRMKQSITREQEYIRNLDVKTARSSEQWSSVYLETFTGGTCSTCGQALPADKLQKARDSFEARKKKRLDEIAESANSFKEEKAQAEDRVKRCEEDIQQIESEIKSKDQEIAAAESNVVVVSDMEGYADRKTAINDRLIQLTSDLEGMVGNTMGAKMDLNRQIAEVNREIKVCMETIGKESVLEYARKRIDQLREDAKNAAECLEAIEKMLYLMDEYSRYKTRFVEDNINGLFRIARFRLFREQANGGVEDRCDVVHDGVPYISVNNGMKINLGIDIINALSIAYGVRVPLFVDNAESVTKLETCGSQIIRLVVSENDKELRVKYEDQR